MPMTWSPGRADQREDLAGHRRAAEPLDQLLLRERSFREERLHQLLVGFRHHLDQLLTRPGSAVRKRVGHVSLRHLAAAVGGKRERLHAHQVDDAGEGALLADGELDRNDLARAIAAQRFERALEARALALQPAHDDDAREVERGGLGPELFRLDFDAGHRVDAHERAFRDAERRLRVAEEVGEARRVDDVDLGLLPLEAGEAGGEGVLAGDLFVVEVGDGRAVVDLAQPVDRACDEQQCRDQLRLAASAVSYHGNVPDGGGVVDLHKGYPPGSRSFSEAP